MKYKINDSVVINNIEWVIAEHRMQRGREWMLQEEIGMSCKLMCERFVRDMDTGFEKWTPQKRFTLYKA